MISTKTRSLADFCDICGRPKTAPLPWGEPDGRGVPLAPDAFARHNLRFAPRVAPLPPRAPVLSGSGISEVYF